MTRWVTQHKEVGGAMVIVLISATVSIITGDVVWILIAGGSYLGSFVFFGARRLVSRRRQNRR